MRRINAYQRLKTICGNPPHPRHPGFILPGSSKINPHVESPAPTH
jgi:hypothetical protein